MDIQIHKDLLTRYRIVKEIGHGTQGRVYEAHRKVDNRRVAIKELAVDSVKNWKSYDLFLREGEVLQNLDVPGVAKVYETVEYLDDAKPSAYIIQEFVEGETIQAMMSKGYRFSFENVCTIAIRLLDILTFLHHHDPPIIHRDIKPSNILVQMENKTVKDLHLIDFGAVANPQIQSGGSTVAGTYGYMAPEQLMGNPCPATDTYAVGVMLAYMLSGVEPADMEVDRFKLNITPCLKSQPPEVIQLLNRMIAVDINDRLSDTEILRNYFSDLKSNKFSLSALISNGYNSKNYNKKLLACHYPGEQRNLQIWEDFPDDHRLELPKEIENALTLYKEDNAPDYNVNSDLMINHDASSIAEIRKENASLPYIIAICHGLTTFLSVLAPFFFSTKPVTACISVIIIGTLLTIIVLALKPLKSLANYDSYPKIKKTAVSSCLFSSLGVGWLFALVKVFLESPTVNMLGGAIGLLLGVFFTITGIVSFVHLFKLNPIFSSMTKKQKISARSIFFALFLLFGLSILSAVFFNIRREFSYIILIIIICTIPTTFKSALSDLKFVLLGENKPTKNTFNNNPAESKQVNSHLIDKLRRLMSDGKKVLATVVDINCVQTLPNNRDLNNNLKEVYLNRRQNALVLSQHGQRNYNSSNEFEQNIYIQPLYEIKYRFKFGHDLYDSVVRTHCNPFIKLKIGDEFPALCTQYKNKITESMPYPWDLNEMVECLDNPELAIVSDCKKYKSQSQKSSNAEQNVFMDMKSNAQKQYFKKFDQNVGNYGRKRKTNKMNVRGSGR